MKYSSNIIKKNINNISLFMRYYKKRKYYNKKAQKNIKISSYFKSSIKRSLDKEKPNIDLIKYFFESHPGVKFLIVFFFIIN